MDRLLQVGDIIRLKEGTYVGVTLPEWAVYTNCPLSEQLTHTVICIGTVCEKAAITEKDAIQIMFKTINGALAGVDVPRNKVKNLVRSLHLNYEPQTIDTTVYAGDYRVKDAYMEKPASTSISHVSSPKGWKVICEKIDNPSLVIDFHQNEAPITVFELL